MCEQKRKSENKDQKGRCNTKTRKRKMTHLSNKSFSLAGNGKAHQHIAEKTEREMRNMGFLNVGQLTLWTNAEESTEVMDTAAISEQQLQRKSCSRAAAARPASWICLKCNLMTNSLNWKVFVTLNTGFHLYEPQIPLTWIDGSSSDARLVVCSCSWQPLIGYFNTVDFQLNY